MSQLSYGLGQTKQDIMQKAQNDTDKFMKVDVQEEREELIIDLSTQMQIEHANTSKIYQMNVEEVLGFFVFKSDKGIFNTEELTIIHDGKILTIQMKPRPNEIRIVLVSDHTMTFNFSVEFKQGVAGVRKTYNEKVTLVKSKSIDIDDARTQLNEEIVIKFEIDFRQYISDTILSKDFDQRGIINEGNTCYMNSLLQLLSHLNCFKRVVYAINQVMIGKFPASDLFYQLQQSNSDPVKITPLLKSFDWNIEDAWVQHDVQEFFMILIEALDKKLTNDDGRLESSVMKLFKGSTSSEIQCLNSNEVSKRVDVFTDVQLDVEGLSSLEDSLRKYVQPVHLSGDNMFYSETSGKQEAIQKLKFTLLPPILIFHLKRFSFENGQQRKLLDRYEYPEVLNHFDNDVYYLYGILSHRGNAINAGHYVAYIKDFESKQWVSFNDQQVRVVSKIDAVDGNFGGKELIGEYNQHLKRIVESTYEKKHSAYMLVYVSKKHFDEIFSPLKSKDIPDWITIREQEHKKKLAMLETRRTQFQIPVIKYSDLKSFGSPLGILFPKRAKSQNLLNDQMEKRLLMIPHEYISCNINNSFRQLLSNNKLSIDTNQIYYYRALRNHNNHYYSEMLQSANFYMDIKLDVMRNALDTQNTQPALIIFDQISDSHDGGEIIIFIKIILNKMLKTLYPLIVTEDQDIQHLVYDIIRLQPHIEGLMYVFQDSFFNIHKINEEQQSIKSFKQSIKSTGSYLTIIFMQSEQFHETYRELTNLPLEFNVLDENHKVLGQIYVAEDSSYQQLIEELNQFKYNPDFLLIKYRSNEQWVEIDYCLIQQLSEQKRLLIKHLSQEKNELIIQKHMVPFGKRVFVEFCKFELMSGNPDNIHTVQVSIECRKDEACQDVILKLLEQEYATAQDFGLDAKQNKLMIVQKEKDCNYIHHVIPFQRITGWSMARLNEKFKIQITKEAHTLSLNKLLLLCNFRLSLNHYDDQLHPFWLYISKHIKVEELYREIKQVLSSTSMDKTKIPRMQLWISSDKTLNGKNIQRLHESMRDMPITNLVSDLYQKIYVDIEFEQSQDLRINI